jgi:putative ABC transport system permease protein
VRKLRALMMRLCGLLNFRRGEDDFAAELESHVAMHTEDGIRAGLSAEESRRQALIRLGGADQTRQAWRERNTLPWLENLRLDARYTFRRLRNSPGYTITAVLTLGLAIGANTAIFSLVHAILLRQLPFNDPSRVLTVENGMDAGLGFNMDSKSIVASFNEAAGSFKTIENATMYASIGVNVELGEGSARRLKAAETGAHFLDVLGVTPHLGRGFAPDEDVPGKDRIALISDRLWRSGFHADPGALGKTIRANGVYFVIVGVLPPQMDFPANVDVWTPTVFDQHTSMREAGAYISTVLVRARANNSAAAVRAEVTARAANNSRQETAHASEPPPDARPIVTPIAAELTKSIRTSLLMLSLAVLFLLAIACSNVAGLALARTAARRREFAVRTALGATRRRVIAQQLVESLFVALAGGAAGVLFANGALRLLYLFRPAALDAFQRPAIDASVLIFTASIAIATGIAFGMAPAWLAGDADPGDALRAGTSHASIRGARLRKMLVSGEMGIAFVLLVGAGLLLRTMANMDKVPLGYDTKGILSFSVALHGEPYISKQANTPAISAFCAGVLHKLAGIPGVTAVGAVSSPPLDTRADMLLPVIAADGGERQAGGAPRVASDGYFGVMGIPVIEGRGFSSQDNRTNPRVVIVTKDLADKLWPGQSPIGRPIHCFWYCDASPTVIGVVPPNRRSGPRGDSISEFYFPSTQQDWTYFTFVLRTSGNPAELASSARRAVAAVDPSQPVYDLETMRDRLNNNESLLRFELFALSVFAVLSVLLVLIGLYGVVSYTVTQQTREIGIRIALGAKREAVLMSLLSESALITLVGEALGLAASLVGMRLLATALFGLTPHDPETLIVVGLLFLLVATAATYLPARRAASIDPMQALRIE